MSRIATFCALFVGLFAASAFTEISAAPPDDTEVVEPAPVVVQGSNAALMPRKDESGKIIGTPSKIASLPGPMWRAEVELPEGCDWVASNSAEQVDIILPGVTGSPTEIIAEIHWNAKELTWTWNSSASSRAATEMLKQPKITRGMVIHCSLDDGRLVNIRFTSAIPPASLGATPTPKVTPDAPRTATTPEPNTQAPTTAPPRKSRDSAKMYIYFWTLPEPYYSEAVQRLQRGEPRLTSGMKSDLKIRYGGLDGERLRAAVLLEELSIKAAGGK
jgi:hypothetical protein